MKISKEIQIEVATKLLADDKGLITLANVLKITNAFGMGIHGYDYMEGFYKREGLTGKPIYYGGIKWDTSKDDLRLQDHETQSLVLSWFKGLLFYEEKGGIRIDKIIKENNYES